MKQSRNWAEYWDSDRNRYFYYNSQTEDAVWEPPSAGYIKADGKVEL